MKLILDSKDFKHIKEKSCYNHNYYMYIGSNHCYVTTIYEVCHEDYNFYEFFFMEGDNKSFLGCGYDSLGDDKVIEIDYQLYYT